MSSTNPSQGVSDPAQGKGKGKANDPPHDVSMGEEDSSSDEETGAEDEVCCAIMATFSWHHFLRDTANTFHLHRQRKSVSLPIPNLPNLLNLPHIERTADIWTTEYSRRRRRG